MRIRINSSKWRQAFTVMETSTASTMAVLAFGGIIYGYTQSGRNAEWSAYSLAAQSLAMQGIEQCRACKWDPDAASPVDELMSTNFLTQISLLDVPSSGTNVIYATNFTTISNLSTAPPLKMISVNAVWKFTNGRLYTNSFVTYRAPDA